MNKAVPWNVNGVGFDAREAAREAARRQGKSLGEWLHGVIADHASQLGVEENEVVGQDRVEAVSSRLERMSARASSFDRRPREDPAEERVRARPTPRALDEDREEPEETFRRRAGQRDRAGEPRRARNAAPVIEETEFLLEEAIDAMERRALRAERRTDDALASFAEMIEKNEARRDRERNSVTMLSQKLSEIESRLGENDQSPIKGALARLEARLEAIGRRTVAETAVKPSLKAAGGAEEGSGGNEPIRRLEEKLNAVLDAVAARGPTLASSVSPIAIAASHDGPQRQRRLGDAIAEISSRQRALDDPHARFDEPRRPIGRHPEAFQPRAAPASQHASIAVIQDEIAALNTKIDGIHRAVATGQQAPASRTGDLDRMNTQIAAMTKTLGELAARHPLREARLPAGGEALERIQSQMQEIRELVASTATRPVDLEPIEHQIATLTDRLNQQSSDRNSGRDIDTAAAIAAMEERFKSRMAGAVDVGSLESMVRDLGAKIEAVQAPGAGTPAIEALQDQIGVLAARFERSESGLASLSSLERSMQELFAHLEETRASVETSAAKAAREAIRLATENGRGDAFDQGRDMAAIRALQHEADARTHSTLEAVHETLEKVVDRLSVMEHDLAEVRARPKVTIAETPRPPLAPRKEARKDSAPDIRQEPRPDTMPTLGGLDRAGDPMFAHMPPDRDRAATPGAPRRRHADLDEEAGRADFIAAARRAAQAAQNDASVVAMKRQPSGSPDEMRAGLAAKSRDFVATHKRPVLLSLAAIFVIIGTMAVMHRMTLDDVTSEVAEYRAPAKIVRAIEAPRQPVRTASSAPLDELTPSALPKSAPPLENPIPGSDPIQTGSIPSLPSFAAQGASTPPPALPSGLVRVADAGNAAADYELAVRFAEGKGVTRDFKLAAKYYEKAADQGLAPAQYRLASLYEKGLGVAQDKLRAKSLYTKAAEAGNPRAMHNLAVLLADGNGKPDYEAAATWFRRAAQYGVHDSQYNLAILLARGLGVQQSLVQSYQWFAVAADQQDVDAAAKRDEVASKLSASDLSVAKALAASFHPRTADLTATEVRAPAGGWDGASTTSPLNSARSKISSL